MQLIYLRLLRLIAMATGNRDLVAPKAPWTTVLMLFTDGSRRTFVFERVCLRGEQLHQYLDPLVEEMEGMDFAGPIEVYRCNFDGQLEEEVIGLLPIDD